MGNDWDEADFLNDLSDAIERFDQDGTAKLIHALIAGLHAGAEPTPAGARRILQALRRKCYFDLLEQAAEAFRLFGLDAPQIRRQYAQSLLDQGKTKHAIDVIESLIARTEDDPEENTEACGLLGRAYKQLYVDAVEADENARTLRLSRLNLQRAVSAYHDVYRAAPAKNLWHGINTVALVCRARRDGIALDPQPDPLAMAREILARIESAKAEKTIGHWDMATAAEACVALEDYAGAVRWITGYVQQEEADAFELSSTERQLREVWNLTIDRPPGSLLLPLLQSHILMRKGGRVDLAGGTLSRTITETENRLADQGLEKVLGHEGVVTLQWYRQGLERCRGIAQVRTTTGEGHGTGFLVRGRDLMPDLGNELLLLTNAHVISDDPDVQASVGALPPEDAVMVFEALESAAGREFRVDALLWTSPPQELDATILRLDPPVEAITTYPIARNLPVLDGKQKVYIIGHPGGRSLSLSLHDNVLLDYDDRLLHYRTPTEPGSSGSPTFNQQWKLIGLHHAGSLHRPRLNGAAGTYAANEGIWIQRIIREVGAT